MSDVEHGLEAGRELGLPVSSPEGLTWLGGVWGLVRHARGRGEVVDEFALAALIDVESALEVLPGLEPVMPPGVGLSASEAIGRALALVRGVPSVPAGVEGWLADALWWVVRS